MSPPRLPAHHKNPLSLIASSQARRTARLLKVWEKGINFKEALWNDGDFMKVVKPKEIEGFFDLGYYTKHVDKIFKKVGI